MLYLFDIDGTLLWTGGAGSIALNRVFERRYGSPDAMNGISCGGKTDPMIVGEMFENSLGRAPSGDETRALLEEYESELAIELASAPNFRVLPHAKVVLEALSADVAVTLAIATGNTERGADAKLARAGLNGYFLCGGYGSDSGDRGRLVEIAIERARAASGRERAAKDIVVVGDTPRDVSAARHCGVRVVAVATGHPTRAELEAAEPDAVIDSLEELLGWHAAR